MLEVNQLVGFGVAGGGSHKFWRVYCTASPYSYFGTLEIEMRAAPGGVDLCNGGTAIASGSQSGYSPALAFDGTTSDWRINTQGVGAWIGYEFPAPVEVKEIVMLDAIINSFPITGARIDFSDDGAQWNPLKEINPVTHILGPEPLLGTNHSYMIFTL